MEREWKKISLLGLAMFLSPFVWLVSAASLGEEAVFQLDTENGPIIVQGQGLPYTGGERVLARTPWVVWSNYLTDAIYNTTSNTINDHVFAGTYLNPPEEARLFALAGGGVPEWGYSGTEFFTDAGDGAFTLAAVDEDAAGVNVIKWTGPGDGIPDWTTSFAGYGITTYGPIAVSDNGSTVAVIAAPPGTDAHLLLFDAGSSTPLDNYVATGLGFPRYVKINADGRYTAFIASATIVVYDRDLLSVRDQIAMGFTNSALDISGDGNLIAYGWPTLRLMQWNGLSYQELWSWNPGATYYVGTIAISTDGTTIVSGWYTTLYNTIKVAVHSVGSSTPLWTYDYPVSSGVYQEIARDIDITDDGEYFIVGSFGDADNLNPEVHIFQRDNTPYVYFTVDMPGSMYSVDIFSDGTYATACGKHIHANEMGRGGDIIMINNDIIGILSNDFAKLPFEFVLISNYPNPFNSRTVISYQLPDISSVKLEVFNLLGEKVVTMVDEKQEAGYRSVSWDGRDNSGEKVSSGVYFLKFEVGDYKETKKLLLLR